MAFYPAIPASDGTSMAAPENSEFKVFELSDTARANPLPLQSSAGLNAAPLVTTAQGVLPPVNVISPNFRHVFKSGEWEWERQSFDGAQEATEAAAADAARSAAAAEKAASEVTKPADQAVDEGIKRADLPKQIAEGVAAQPTVVAAAAAAVDANPKIAELEGATIPKALSDAMAYADGRFIPAWKATTAYTAGQRVIAPNGDVVAAKTAFTSGTTYDGAQWNASAQDVRLAAAEWRRGAVPVGDLDAATKPGFYYLSTVNHASNPFPGKFCFVEVRDFAPFGTGVIQEATTWEVVPRTSRRIFNVTWRAWDAPVATTADLTATQTALEAKITAAQKSTGGRTGTKVVPLAITAAQGPFTEVLVDNSVRWVRQYAVAPSRIKVHISNYNPGQGTKGSAVSLNGIWISKGAADGSVTDSQLALGEKVLPGDGSELVTPWMEAPINDGEYLAVSVAWYAAAGATVVQMQGGGWVANDNAIVQDATVAGPGWTRKQATPFHVWVEAEVPASTPVVCGHGDSITIGTAATDPVADSFIAKYAFEQGALPVILAEHGSTMLGWNISPRRWDQYPGINLPAVVDATITTLGQNDLAASGITLAELQKRHRDMVPLLARNVGGVVYTGFVTPSTKSADLEAIRKEYNSWLATLPTGARGVFDFAKAVGTADGEALRPEFSADGLHPNSAGQQAMADMVVAHPITSYTLPPSKVKALAALL